MHACIHIFVYIYIYTHACNLYNIYIYIYICGGQVAWVNLLKPSASCKAISSIALPRLLRSKVFWWLYRRGWRLGVKRACPYGIPLYRKLLGLSLFFKPTFLDLGRAFLAWWLRLTCWRAWVDPRTSNARLDTQIHPTYTSIWPLTNRLQVLVASDCRFDPNIQGWQPGCIHPGLCFSRFLLTRLIYLMTGYLLFFPVAWNAAESALSGLMAPILLSPAVRIHESFSGTALFMVPLQFWWDSQQKLDHFLFQCKSWMNP